VIWNQGDHMSLWKRLLKLLKVLRCSALQIST
jgi:hypothetical protein